MRVFTVIAVLLALVLVGWIAIALLYDAHARPELLGVGAGFTSVGNVSEAEITKTVNELVACWKKEVDLADAWHLAGEIAAWISFALTAIITMMMGAYGQPIAGAEPTAEERAALIEQLQKGETPASRRRGARLVVLVGLVAAAASVLTATSSRLEAKSLVHEKAVTKIHSVLEQGRQTLRSNPTEAEAHRALDSMRDACIRAD